MFWFLLIYKKSYDKDLWSVWMYIHLIEKTNGGYNRYIPTHAQTQSYDANSILFDLLSF